MKTFISSLTLLAMTGFGSVLAQAETVILTISVNGAAEQYYKVQEFLEQIQATQRPLARSELLRARVRSHLTIIPVRLLRG